MPQAKLSFVAILNKIIYSSKLHVQKIILSLALASVLTGCASVNMASKAESAQAKAFNAPSKGWAAVYIYRNSNFGGSSKKDIFINGKCLGESVANVFFYTELEANKTHKIETESEFSPNGIDLPTQPDATYFVRQHIKMGAFVPDANLEIVSEAQGKADIAPLEMAQPGQCGG